jgi:hypothetical protein
VTGLARGEIPVESPIETVHIKRLYHASLLKLHLSGKIEPAAPAAGKVEHPIAGCQLAIFSKFK